MGSFAKALGRLSRRSLETESANILKTCQANKVPGSLSLALDGTLRSGHDMKTFGLGTMAAMAGVPSVAPVVSVVRVLVVPEGCKSSG